nr:PREDICTED: G-protein coupled receptor 4-like isoform X1 [Lepisosteus oculatus]
MLSSFLIDWTRTKMDYLTPAQSAYSWTSNSSLNNSCGINFTIDSVFLPVLYGIFFTVGIPLNLLALYGLYRLVKSENVLPVYVINLLLSDLLQLITLPLWIDYYSRKHIWRFGPSTCQAVGLIFYISLYAGIFFLCVIALERHLAIAWPLKFQALRRLQYARWVALGLWMVVAVPPSVAFGVLFPKNKEDITFCIEKYPSDQNFTIYRLITLVLSFVIPFSFIGILHRKTLKSLAEVSSLASEEKWRIQGLLNLVIIIFVLVLGPYHFIGSVKYVVLLFHPNICEWEKSIFVFYQLGRVLLSLNSLLDPILYIFLRKDFQEVICMAVPCLSRKQNGLEPSRTSPSFSKPIDRLTNSTIDSEM